MSFNSTATALTLSSSPSTILVALVKEQRKQSKDEGNTVNLRNLGITETLPVEVIEMIKDEVSRYPISPVF